MKTGDASAFAKFREEIQLWPAAAMAFIVTEHDTIGALVAFVILLFTGATTYRLHETIRKAMMTSSSNKEQQVREANYREGVYDASENNAKNVLDFAIALVPNRQAIRWVVALALLTNFGAGLLLFWHLLELILGPTSPTVPVMGLVSLPLLMIATSAASLLWNL
ncbi:hypothetical protein [Haladaptatus sp. YSMS36]|uniref:hypothetical protein n=1 Tax=Haladaptatus sp. YSMS36 TaxID=3033384 RepID=UPI0023E7B881|nr:hypothetical protein [Haladaptatus sp. YSMS36]